MPSFQIGITPSRRAAARFILAVRRALQKALAEEAKARGLTQSDIAREIAVHRSVVNRELRGQKDITLGRVAELAFAMGREAVIDFPIIERGDRVNVDEQTSQFRVLSSESLDMPQQNDEPEVRLAS